MTSQTLCKKCVLPESKPYVYFDSNGVCNLCNSYQQNFQESRLSSSQMHESDFVKIINKHKGKNKYDCLLMCSGGKDSVSSLYFVVKRYKLNPLVFTFDHGFETDEALSNIHKAVDRLSVDFLFYKTSNIKKLFKKIIEQDSQAVICHVCSMWYMSLTYETAAKYNIPIIIAGWTKGQSNNHEIGSKLGNSVNYPEFQKMAEATRNFLIKIKKEDPLYKDFPLSMDDVLKKFNSKNKAVVLSPHWFLPYDHKECVEIIKKELDWKMPTLSYPAGSTNCLLNYLASERAIKHFGYTHYHIECSKLIREGMMTREEALINLELNMKENLLDEIKNKLNIK